MRCDLSWPRARARWAQHPMTNADWWATVKTPGQVKERPPRPSGRVWTMHHGTHEAALDLRLVAGFGAEIVLSIDNELRRARFYWRTQAGDAGRYHLDGVQAD